MKTKIVIVGLGKMGSQIAQKLSEGGFEVIPHKREDSKEKAVVAFGGERPIIWLMIPAEAVDQDLAEWLQVLPGGSTIVDGGNSDFRLTRERAKKVREAGAFMLDVGTSGGVWGYQNGFSMMCGGEESAFREIEPVLQVLARPSGAYWHFGESGSGHFVKMVHNAIEYGMMESLAEGYRLLKEGPYKGLDLAAAGDVWQHRSVITSWLNELTRDVLKENPELEGVEGYVAESGEARWALETFRELKIDAPAIEAAFQVRLDSGKGKVNFATKLLAAMRNAFGGHKINK